MYVGEGAEERLGAHGIRVSIRLTSRPSIGRG